MSQEPKQPSSMQSLFAEMKRRRVFKVMAVYGAVAFLVLQAADLVFPMLSLPEWTIRLVLGLALLGFPLAVVLAWAFESTPEGVKRTAPARVEEIQAIVAEPRSKRWPAGLLALIAMILLFGTGWWMGGGGSGAGGERAANLLVGEAQASGFKALAVLPFENVNGDDDNRLIAVGVQSDLTTRLSRIAALRVTSRTSVREYENTDKSLRDIADELGVEYILEGSVLSSGENALVSVTLVDAATDQTLWSEEYNRVFTPGNLFEVQAEIGQRVVGALEAQLTPAEVATLEAMEPASDLAAQSWYYRAIEAYVGSLTGAQEARDHLTRSIDLDSGFVAAWSKLAHMESRVIFIGGDGDEATALAAVERTAELAPGSVEANLARGFYEYYAQQNFSAALSAFQAAQELAPSDSEVAWAVGLIHRRQGDWDASTEALRRAVALDPRNALRLETLAENLTYAGAYEDADAVIERGLTVDPGNHRTRAAKVGSLLALDGNTERAQRLALELGLDPSNLEEGSILHFLAVADGQDSAAVRIVDEMDTGGPGAWATARLLWKSQSLARLGDPASAAVADSMLPSASEVPGFPSWIPTIRGYAHALAGRSDQALEELLAAERLVRGMEDQLSVGPAATMVALAYGRIGELDRGFGLLDDIVERPNDGVSAVGLHLAPEFDPYRTDPRFDDFIARREAFEAEGARKAAAGRPWLP
ncbi:MAG: tetratricopeptide repeat protein [Gemmatimonadota bacterium]